ncbi:MAG: hypothetical protein V7K67_22300 [Nostoc sp.]|uniref:hypothetical protein n=1 Tax=Nostoc sp. TaxID=1180 RepID=UPI002FF7208C
MLYTNQQIRSEEYEEITVTIGQKVKFWDSLGKENYGTIIAVDKEDNSVDVVIGTLFLYTETVDANDLIEG